jgi:predicted nucleotidyltransferase
MHPLIEEKREQVDELCRKFKVRRLELFGSAAGGTFDPQRSDLDFLVEFLDLNPAEYANAFLGLIEALEQLFRRPVDLVVPRSIENKYFRQSIDRNRTLVYAA